MSSKIRESILGSTWWRSWRSCLQLCRKNRKKNQSNDNDKQINGGQKNKENDGLVMVVLKVDLHCEGCAEKTIKSVRSVDGMESAKKEGNELKKITVIGTPATRNRCINDQAPSHLSPTN